MKRIAYHPAVHPAQPWCVFETGIDNTDVERLPKIALYGSRSDAQAAHPDAVVDPEHSWECQLRVEDTRPK